MENPDVVWIDLSKFNNYLDWTEQDIEDEVNIVNEDFFITAWKKANGMDQKSKGGWSESNLDNKKGSNKYIDTTLGCIRISNLDVFLIEKTLNAYLAVKKINLEVK